MERQVEQLAVNQRTIPQDAIASLLERLVRHAMDLLGWRGTSFFAALKDGELLVETGDQLPDSCLRESILSDRMLALQAIKALLQIAQL
jgi:hypothetical protein